MAPQIATTLIQQSTQYPWPVGGFLPRRPGGRPTARSRRPRGCSWRPRNHAMPLEALRRGDFTAPGLHYVLTHFDIPDLDAAHLAPAGWRSRGTLAGNQHQAPRLRKEPRHHGAGDP